MRRAAGALETRIAAIESVSARAATRPRVLCLEWLDPYFVGGHWIPEMVWKAGGEDVVGKLRQPSFKVTSEEILASRPDVIAIMPCGYGTGRIAEEFRIDQLPHGADSLPAVQQRRVFAVDANAYFSRPGPRLADGVAILAHIIHPDLFPVGIEGGSRPLL